MVPDFWHFASFRGNIKSAGSTAWRQCLSVERHSPPIVLLLLIVCGGFRQISRELGISRCAVDRTLRLIREQWPKELQP